MTAAEQQLAYAIAGALAEGAQWDDLKALLGFELDADEALLRLSGHSLS